MKEGVRRPAVGFVSLGVVVILLAATPALGSPPRNPPRLTPSIGSSSSLRAVSADSPSDAWAVGSRYTGTENKTLVVHWDGTSWTRVPSPSPGKTAGSILTGVSADSSTDAWAVGGYGELDRPLVLHWDGTNWTKVPSPSPVFSILYGVTAVSASDAWAVGSYDGKSLILQWNGTHWSQVSSPNPGDGSGTYLQAVSADSASDAWAVGRGDPLAGSLIEHWDGTSWSVATSPARGYLMGVAVLSASDAWAVGHVRHRHPQSDLTVIEHWDGAGWTQVPSANPTSFSFLVGVSAVSADDAWAVGSYFRNTRYVTLIEHWDGATWSVVPSPNPGGRDDTLLGGVSAVSANQAWAVGDYGSSLSSKTLIEGWDGSRWTQAKRTFRGAT